MKAELTKDGRIRIYGETYSYSFPADRLAAWIAFYERMHLKYGRRSYMDTALNLKALEGETDG